MPEEPSLALHKQRKGAPVIRADQGILQPVRTLRQRRLSKDLSDRAVFRVDRETSRGEDSGRREVDGKERMVGVGGRGHLHSRVGKTVGSSLLDRDKLEVRKNLWDVPVLPPCKLS